MIFEPLILLPPGSKYQDYRHALPSLASTCVCVCGGVLLVVRSGALYVLSIYPNPGLLQPEEGASQSGTQESALGLFGQTSLSWTLFALELGWGLWGL